MNTTLNYLNARRAWLIRDLNVWGSLSIEIIDAAATAIDDTQTRVVYEQFTLGGVLQELPFASLTDHRGNLLPASIDSPVVILIPKNSIPTAILGQPSPTSFRIAKTIATPEDAVVDLWIIEARP